MTHKKLTAEENEFASKGTCPNCKDMLCTGPRGGLAMNVGCKTCGAVIWLVPGLPMFGAEWRVEGNPDRFRAPVEEGKLIEVEAAPHQVTFMKALPPKEPTLLEKCLRVFTGGAA